MNGIYNPLYDNTKPVSDGWQQLAREIGVCATDPANNFIMVRTGHAAELVEVIAEAPIIHTRTNVQFVAPDKLNASILEQTGLVIEQIDRVIAELQTHRERMLASAIALDAQMKATAVLRSIDPAEAAAQIDAALAEGRTPRPDKE